MNDTRSTESGKWRDVDADPERARRYLAQVSEQMAAHKAASIARLALSPGGRALEIGFGNGEEAEAMARRVVPGGEVVAVDLSAELVAAARARVEAAALPLRFEVADAHALPFSDGEFDAVRVERVLQHVADPAQVVSEMVRVARPGGVVYAAEPDWELLLLPGDPDVRRAVVRYWTEGMIANGRIGREAPELFRAAGAVDLDVDIFHLVTRDFELLNGAVDLRANVGGAVREGWITAEAGEAWLFDLAARSAAGTFFAFAIGVVVLGRAPGSPGAASRRS